MKAFHSSLGLSVTAETEIMYGKEEGFASVWKKIVDIKDLDDRKRAIDKIIGIIENNKKDNGFISRDDVVKIPLISAQKGKKLFIVCRKSRCCT